MFFGTSDQPTRVRVVQPGQPGDLCVLAVPPAEVLKDLDSQNGTSVDGKRVQAATLRHHDCILAGRTLFLFSEKAASAKSRAKT